MTGSCDIQNDGSIELYFYGELDEQSQGSVRAPAHLPVSSGPNPRGPGSTSDPPVRPNRPAPTAIAVGVA